MDSQIWFHKYKVIKKLGQGGSGDVFLVHHMKLDTLRAVKRINKKHKFHEQLLKEAHLLKDLTHSSIPIIHDFEEDKDYSYIIEQYMEGQTLHQYKSGKIKLSTIQITNIGIQLCDLLLYLYSLKRPILYLDLNPDNIIMIDNVVKLIDFGAASFKDEVHKRRYSFGTIGYASPEMYTKLVPDERADIYGIGSLLFFLITGKAYDRDEQLEPSNALDKRTLKVLYPIIRRCLSYYPAIRYSSVSVLKKKLVGIHKIIYYNKEQSNNSKVIAIAGSQSRVGVTHISLLITSHYQKEGMSSLYIERNPSGFIKTIMRRNLAQYTNNIIYRYKGCNLLIKESSTESLSHIRIKVVDYGVLSDNNIIEFMDSDIKILVLGGKEWELDASEKVLSIIHKKEEIRYAFNYLSGGQFRNMCKGMHHLLPYRIPYVPDPFVQIDFTMVTFLNRLLEE